MFRDTGSIAPRMQQQYSGAPMSKSKAVLDIPPRDELLSAVLATLRQYPDGLSEDVLVREVAIVVGCAHLLTGDRKPWTVFERCVRNAVGLAERSGFASWEHDRIVLTQAGLAADDVDVDAAWRREVQRDDRSKAEKVIDRMIDNFFDNL